MRDFATCEELLIASQRLYAHDCDDRSWDSRVLGTDDVSGGRPLRGVEFRGRPEHQGGCCVMTIRRFGSSTPWRRLTGSLAVLTLLLIGRAVPSAADCLQLAQPFLP